MNAVKAAELIKKYAKCPDCGSELVGKNQGVLEITDNKFLRKCKCGFKIEVTEK
jgi:transcription elongation factor Elf1